MYWYIFLKDFEVGKGLILKVATVSSFRWRPHQVCIIRFKHKGDIIKVRSWKCNPLGNCFWGYAELRRGMLHAIRATPVQVLADGTFRTFRNKVRIQLSLRVFVSYLRGSWYWVRSCVHQYSEDTFYRKLVQVSGNKVAKARWKRQFNRKSCLIIRKCVKTCY